ncbi:GNAT family N-acetyltransferase [Tumebacillus permanentifrigoris]|uniref:Acetyltransferase (GNAT) family protein n=1 Tax=Tumebacillus permanentifrigoris TaxID=378543 RepID=A0A316DD14_9BACL|nr:GNAT family N-acetyltransferase [Tumebacillus permanentifrigoris]PWK14393.1 acetyltransferase (GNAT) family protein [Tumebacillus permanentifrigoris]
MEIYIRPVRPGDVFAITRTVLAARGFRGAELERQLERDLQRFREQNIIELIESDTWVAVDGSRMVGVMRYGEFEGDVHLTKPDIDPAFDEATVTGAFLQRFWQLVSPETRKAVYLDYADAAGHTLGDVFMQNGFHKLIDRFDMRLKLTKEIKPVTQLLTYSAYSPKTHDRFYEAFRASFAGSLDPMMEWDAAHPEQSFEMFRDRFGEFDPNLWVLATDAAGRDVGFALFQTFRGGRYDGTTMLLYMAVLQGARGQGYGEEITREGLRRVRKRDGSNAVVALTVTRGNKPAERIYERLGFQPIEQFTVYNMLRA